MYPFPAVEFPEDIPRLRNLAYYLSIVGEGDDWGPICYQLVNLDTNAYFFFSTHIANALGPYHYVTQWATSTHGAMLSGRMRPAYAAHISRSIYEQIGA
jgi:hypothetical protein